MPYLKRHVHADFDTPVSTYVKLAHDTAWSFLLESVGGTTTWGRYSVIGLDPEFIVEARGKSFVCTDSDGRQTRYEDSDALEGLRRHLGPASEDNDGLPPFVGGLFGYISYEAVATFEPVPRATTEGEAVPDALFFKPRLLAVVDRDLNRTTLYSQSQEAIDKAYARLRSPLPLIERAPASFGEVHADDSASYERGVDALKEHIRQGDIIQAVLSRQFRIEQRVDPLDIYRGLRVINPSPYLFFVQTPGLAIAGSSPEVMVRVREGTMTLRPIAGTRPRGETLAEDARLAEELLSDPKELAEHVMLVDLGRNDIGRVAKPGSVNVVEKMFIERYSHVMHIVSEVQGELVPSANIIDALKASFPAGTLSGAPKVRAMQLLAGFEPKNRGVYGGAVGYMAPNGDGDFGIAIRTMVARGGELVLQAGAGIVLDSDPVREREETEHKARAVLKAAQWAASEDARWPR